MHEPIILLDVDGVLVDLQEENIARLNLLFGTSYTKDSVVEFDYSNFPDEHREFLISLWYEVDYSKCFLTPTQLETIDGLRTLGRVVACSSPLVGHADSKLEFLHRYFDRRDIALARDKSLIQGEILIDDAPHQIQSFPGHVIIFDQPWNTLVPGPRAYEFDDIGPQVISYLMTCEDYDLS